MYNVSFLGSRSMLTIPRLSYGTSSRLQRLHPTETMKFHDREIPAGVSYLILLICCKSSRTSNS
jgi:hypothetical protein